MIRVQYQQIIHRVKYFRLEVVIGWYVHFGLWCEVKLWQAESAALLRVSCLRGHRMQRVEGENRVILQPRHLMVQMVNLCELCASVRGKILSK